MPGIKKEGAPVRVQTFGAEDNIPLSFEETLQLKQHVKRPRRRPRLKGKNEENEGKEEEEEESKTGDRPQSIVKKLDGFTLLDSCNVEFPDSALRVNIQGRDLECAVAEDLVYFVNVSYANLGDNKLRLDMLEALKSVEEVHLACNGIEYIRPIQEGSFKYLAELDLSYNAIDPKTIIHLKDIPSLRELDLTCNAITEVPSSWKEFYFLEKLSLERNDISSHDVFTALSDAPRLRVLNLSQNYLRSFPPECAFDGGMQYLGWIDVSGNRIESEIDIIGIMDLRALIRVELYDNPLTVQTKELPLLNEQISKDFAVEIVTVNPRKKRGISVRDQSLYSGFDVTKVAKSHIKTARQWREHGNRLLFPDYNAKKSAPKIKDALPETDSKEEKSDDDDQDDEGGAFFLTAGNDEVSQSESAANENGRGEEENIIALDEPPSLLHFPQIRLDSAVSSTREVPQPTKLRSAVSSLKHMLRQTNAAGASIGPSSNFLRPTRLQQLRQKPKIPYVPMEKRKSKLNRRPKHALSRVEDMLDKMKQRMEKVETDTRSFDDKDAKVQNLIGMIDEVMRSFDSNKPKKAYFDDDEDEEGVDTPLHDQFKF